MTLPVADRGSSTPILDRIEPFPPPVKPGLASSGLLIGLCYGASIVMALSSWTGSIRSEPWAIVALVFAVLSVVIVVPVVMAIHELGHVVGGLVAGYRFEWLRVWTLQLDRSFRVSRHRSADKSYGASAMLQPVKLDRLRLRATCVALAGPASNILSGAAVLLLPSSLRLFSVSFFCFSLLSGLRELLPLRPRAEVTDGRRLWMLWIDRAAGERWLTLSKLECESMEDLMTAQSSDSIAKAVAVVDDSPDTVCAHVLAYGAAFQRHEDTEAARMLETCLRYAGQAPTSLRDNLVSEAAVFQADRRKRPDLAREWLALLPETLELPWLRPWAEAAIRAAEGDVEGALEQLDECERGILAGPDPAGWNATLQSLRKWRSELQASAKEPARVGSTPPPADS